MLRQALAMNLAVIRANHSSPHNGDECSLPCCCQGKLERASCLNAVVSMVNNSVSCHEWSITIRVSVVVVVVKTCLGAPSAEYTSNALPPHLGSIGSRLFGITACVLGCSGSVKRFKKNTELPNCIASHSFCLSFHRNKLATGDCKALWGGTLRYIVCARWVRLFPLCVALCPFDSWNLAEPVSLSIGTLGVSFAAVLVCVWREIPTATFFFFLLSSPFRPSLRSAGAH